MPKTPKESSLALALVVAWLASRVMIFVYSPVWTLPDSNKYVAGPDEVAPISLSGHAPSPGWMVPWIYSFFAGNNGRTWAQFVVASACWVVTAFLLARLSTSGWRRNSVFLFVLAFSLCVPVLSLDRIIQTESLTVGLTVLWCALWLTNVCDKARSARLMVALALVGLAAGFTRPQVFVVIVPLSLALGLYALWRTKGRSPISVGLVSSAVFLGLWAPHALLTFDTHNGHESARAYFFSWYRGTNADYLAMERDQGRPPCEAVDFATRDDETASQKFAWDFFLGEYRNQCPELAAWHANSAPGYGARLLGAPVGSIQIIARDLPVLVLPWVRGDTPMPFGLVQAMFFGIPDQSGMVNTEPQPHRTISSPLGTVTSPYYPDGVPLTGTVALCGWLLISVLLVFVSRRSVPKRSRSVIFGVAAILGACLIGIFFSWIGDAWEMDRHSLPWTLMLPLFLIIGPLLTGSKNQAGRVPWGEAADKRPAAALLVAGTTSVVLIAVSAVPTNASSLEPAKQIRPITSLQQGVELRSALSRVLFDAPTDGPISWNPSSISFEVPPKLSKFSTVTLAGTNRLGMKVYANVLRPRKPMSCAVIHNGGHGPWQDAPGVDAFAQKALDNGCMFIALDMLLFSKRDKVGLEPATTANGLNLDGPEIDHTSLRAVEAEGDNMLDLFVAPVQGAVDWAIGQGATNVIVTGHSGGGWVASLAAATDPRIRRSINVAGSADTVSQRNCRADVEQCHPDLLSVISLREIYQLAALEPERRTALVLNLGDPCCYPVSDLSVPRWISDIQLSMSRAGHGTFEYFADGQIPPDHRIGPQAAELLERYVRGF